MNGNERTQQGLVNCAHTINNRTKKKKKKKKSLCAYDSHKNIVVLTEHSTSKFVRMMSRHNLCLGNIVETQQFVMEARDLIESYRSRGRKEGRKLPPQ